VAPDLFALSEIDGHASPTVAEVPEEMIGEAQIAADGCPEQAISVYQAD